MSVLGAIGAAYGLSAVNGVLSSGMQYAANQALQNDSQDFNRSEALRQREFEASQAKIARDWQTNANQIAMDFNHREAELARAFNERMSNTQYQRAVEDMKKAGINPIMVAQLGGANAPSGASASVGGSSASSARGNSASSSSNSVGMSKFDILNSVLDILSTAKKIEDYTDKMEHRQTLREMSQKREARLAEFTNYKMKNKTSSSSSYDVNDFFDAALKRALEDL